MTGRRIPAPLDDLGQVFVPIDPREKGTTRPRTDEHLYGPDDPVLEAYLEAGHNYGVACQNGLAVLDADEPEALQDAIDALPETAWQVSGSGEGEHYFLQVPGFDEDLKLYHPETDDHLGEVKGAAQSYVVGPGSIHPSGGRYGPLQGETIATVEAAELRDVLEPFLRESGRALPHESEFGPSNGPGGVTRDGAASGDDVDLSVFDVVSAGRYPEGERREHPFHGSSTGANFMVDDRGETFRCWRHDCTGNALHLVGIEQRIIDCGEWLPSGLDSDTWSEIFTAVREAGYDLPEFDPGDAGEPVAVLPGSPKARAREWDWQNAGTDPAEPTLSIEDARERTKARIADAYQYGDRVLVEALPTMGKSYGSVAAAAEADVPVTLLTTRGRKEQYAQLREWCDEHGLEAYTLPSFTRDCDTANGEHGEDWHERVMDWYKRGATPKEIHMFAEEALGRPLPCQAEHTCPYASKWDFDPDDYDALIGHYSHAHKPKVTQGRAVVFDEFPGDTYETHLETMLPGAVTTYLQATPELPFEDYTDLIEHRDDDQERRADALAWFHDQAPERDGRQVFDDAAGHAAAPLAVFTLLAGVGDDLGNGWERADLGEHGTGLYDREQGGVHVLSPPPLDYARAVVALDGTPTPALWERALGIELNHRPVLTEAERVEYVRDVLDLDLVRTTQAVKPYNSADHVSTARDAALLEKIGELHEARPAVISTATAVGTDERPGVYDEADIDIFDHIGDTQHYGNVLGSNAFAETRVGAVIGSNHYGDQYIEKWGAYDGAAVERGDGKGIDLSYGEFGDRVLAHMREHETLQAAMRFGRDGNGATVYVHTNTLPEWVPLAGEGRVMTTWSDGMREILDVAEGLEEWTTADLAAEVSIGERTVRDHCHRLVDAGVLTVECEGRGYVWRDDGLHRVSEHGEVELAPVDVDDLGAEEVAEVGRSSTYTWDLRNSAGESAGPPETVGSSDPPRVATASNGGDRPPDDPV